MQICLLSGIWQEPMRRVGQFMSHFPMMVSRGNGWRCNQWTDGDDHGRRDIYFSGTLSEGQIVVDADNAKVQIVFDNVDITCASSAAVYVKSAEKVFVTLAEGSQNTLRNTDEYVAIDDNNIDAVIFAKSDLTLNGTGSLTIISAEGHGIVSKDDLKIIGGTYDITAAGHALSGKDSVRIADGTFILTAEKDGIHAENADDEEKGYIYIADGDFTI